MQLTADRVGMSSPLSTAGTTTLWALQEAGARAVSAIRGGATSALELPALRRAAGELHVRNLALERENVRLQEELAAYRAQLALQPQLAAYPRAVEARVIGFPPESAVQSVTIDKGTHDGVHRDDGVLDAGGVVGRIAEAGPFESKVILVTDFTSTIPAIVQSSRAWGVVRGNQSSLRLEYVSHDAQLRPGDRIVTGEARSFHAGALIGSIARINRDDSNLYQTAVVKPAAELSSLDRVIVISK